MNLEQAVASRMAALGAAHLLEDRAEAALDRVTRLGHTFLRIPVRIAWLTDDDHLVVKSQAGGCGELTPEQQSWLENICRQVVHSRHEVVYSTSFKVPPDQSEPVDDSEIAAFAGVPLASPEGCTLGVLFAADVRPRLWTAEDVAVLWDLAALVETEIQLRWAVERARRQTEAAERASQAKSQFLASMSHELRTPLNAVILYSELLMEEAKDLGIDGFLPDLQTIRNAGNHLLGLINSVLDLSKIEAGRMELLVEDFDVAAMVEDVVATVRPLVDAQSNQLEVDCSPDVGMMHTDLTKVRQILLNLLGNASKFTENGTVRLVVRREAQDGDGWMTFRVQDDGIGMTPEQLTKVFRPFSQADSETSQKYGGTGLGLAITHRLCQMLGGTIDVQSMPDQGTVFTARLPIARNVITAEIVASRGAKEQQGRLAGTVLVIDDDPAVRDMMFRMLQKEGYRAVTARTGEEGLRMARELRPDLITLDVVLPNVDGWTVLSELKGDPELSSIPVIMLTVVDNRNLGYLLGASEYLIKPVSRGRLATLLEKYSPRPTGNYVLLVEDDRATRRVLKEALEQLGCDVAEASDGREALDLVAGRLPNMILLDLFLPRMDGFEVMDELRENPAWKDIPVVVMTEKELTPEERARINGSAQRIVQKGAHTREKILAEVRRLAGAVGNRSEGGGAARR